MTRSFLNLLPPGKTNECGNMRQRSRAASQVSTQEFERLGLRVHDFLAGVRLHDLWAVDLPRTRPGITLDEFLRAAGECPFPLSPVVRALVNIRLFIGRLLGWGSRAGGNRVGNLRNTSDNRRSLEVACAGGNAPGSFSHRVPLRKRATPRTDQPHRSRGGAERPRRNGKCLPLLFRRLCAQRWTLHAGLPGPDRPFPQADRLSVTLA